MPGLVRLAGLQRIDLTAARKSTNSNFVNCNLNTRLLLNTLLLRGVAVGC